VLPDTVLRVCVRCGEPVRVYDYVTCPVHGLIFNVYHVVTRADWLSRRRTERGRVWTY
jgi:hypothetical protein